MMFKNPFFLHLKHYYFFNFQLSLYSLKFIEIFHHFTILNKLFLKNEELHNLYIFTSLKTKNK